MNKNEALFKAAFYADLNTIKLLIKTKNDLQINVPVRNGDYKLFWSEISISISILDILNWAAFGFYEYINQNELSRKSYDTNDVLISHDIINPSTHYYKVINCIEWICNKFSITNYRLKDYSGYRLLRHFLLEDENWLDEDEINEALQNGFKQIDLDLINVAEKGNAIACYNLIKQGATYKIDPVDFTAESTVLQLLEDDYSFNCQYVICYLSRIDNFLFSEAYDMLASLYQFGVGNYILDILKMNEELNKEV